MILHRFTSWCTSPTYIYQDYLRDINTVILTLDTATATQQLATCHITNTVLIADDPRVALITCFWPLFPSLNTILILLMGRRQQPGVLKELLQSGVRCCSDANLAHHACMTPVTYIGKKMQGLGALIRGGTST